MNHQRRLHIIHVLSQTELTGAEVYAVDLANEQRAKGHRVWIVSDNLHCCGQTPYIAMPISKRKYLQRYKNVAALRRLVEDHQVDVIHAHSRAASWVAYWATRGTGTAVVSTIHGRQHLHLSVYTKDIYGESVIAVCENLKTHLLSELRMSASKVKVIPNGLEFHDHLPVRSTLDNGKPARQQLAILGRTSGPKGRRCEDLIQNVLPSLLAEFPELVVIIAGGPLSNFTADSIERFGNMQNSFPGRVLYGGVLPPPSFYKLISESAAVIGSGRVAIQALAMGVPTFAMGESCVPGWVTTETLAHATNTNFGDIVCRAKEVTPTPTSVTEDLRTVLKSGLANRPMAVGIRRKFSVASVASAIEDDYRAAIIKRHLPKWIPMLMYHKVEDNPLPSKHRIFVSTRRFKLHLRFFKWRGFETVTYADLLDFFEGRRRWSEFPRKPLVLTFDDGYESTIANAVPQLAKFNYRGVFFVLGNSEIRTNAWDVADGEPEARLISVDAIAKLASAGHELGAHSMTHPRLTQLSNQQATDEVSASREAVARVAGSAPVSFAYPFGNMNDSVKQVVRNAGFAFGISTDTGGLHLADDPYQVFRVSIFPEDGPLQLWKKTSSWYRRYYFKKRGK